MRILFDQGTSVPLRKYLTEHSVTTAYEEAWSNLSNGDLLKSAEDKGYQIFVTTDRNLRYQQNLSDRQIAIVVLLSTSWPKNRTQTDKVCGVINEIKLGDYAEISI